MCHFYEKIEFGFPFSLYSNLNYMYNLSVYMCNISVYIQNFWKAYCLLDYTENFVQGLKSALFPCV